MFKMIVHVTQSCVTVSEAQFGYYTLVGEIRKHPEVHVNGQIVKKFTGYSPEHPKGHEVTA